MRIFVKMKSIELFLAFGLATTVGFTSIETVNASGANLDSDRTDRSTVLIAQGAEGGEGGSGGAELSPGEQANADFQE